MTKLAALMIPATYPLAGDTAGEQYNGLIGLVFIAILGSLFLLSWIVVRTLRVQKGSPPNPPQD